MYKVKDQVALRIDGALKLGVVIDTRRKSNPLYDVMLEDRSVVIAVPVNKTAKKTYIDSATTTKLFDEMGVTVNLDYQKLKDEEKLPEYRG